jgi:hypothetical protein
LRKTFLKCRRYGISLNPKKTQFALKEGKILEHIVIVEGVKIDPARVESIHKISIPRSKKDIQSFLGKINFIRRFIPNFAELVKHITGMLRKDSEVKWHDAVRDSFEAIKKALMSAPTLINPDYCKYFYIFPFASNDTIAAVLLQRNDQGHEQPVDFFSKTLRDVEVKYEPIKKQAYALIKSLKAFRIYIFHTKVIAYVPSSSVRDVLIQPNIDGKRAKWISKLIEFDVDINPTKLIKGHGLENLLAKENCEVLGINFISINAEEAQSEFFVQRYNHDQPISANLSSCEWYSIIIHFLQTLVDPPEMNPTQVRALKLKAVKFCINENMLYWKDPSGMLLRCLDKEESVQVMHQFHSIVCGGHHYWKTTAQNILRVGYYWPCLFSDVFSYVKTCDKCQRFTGK